MANIKNNMPSEKRPKDKRNLKYGSLSVIITVIFVALVIILNIIFTSLASHGGWYTDMTSSGYFSLSDAFTEQMDNLLHPENGEEVYINAVLMCEEDVFGRLNSQSALIYRSLQQLTKQFDNIRLVAYNTTVHPELAEKYKMTALDTPALDDVVFELCDKDGHPLPDVPAKKFTARSFFVTDSKTGNYIGYRAEAKILSAVALLTGKTDKPTAYYMQGHGEPTLAEAADWKEVLELAGFEIKEINLTKDSFPNENSSDAIVVLNCPKYDLVNTPEFSEVKAIRTFLGTNYGNMIVVEDATVGTLPALDGLLSEWGLGFGNSVTDDSHSVSGSGAAKLFADYSKTYIKTQDQSQPMATQILNKLFGGMDKNLPNTIFGNPKEVKIMDKDDMVAGMNASKNSFALLKTYDTAKTSVNGVETVGSVATLGVSRIVWEMNNTDTSYVIALGSSDFLSSEYNKSCANRDIMFALLNLVWDNTVSFSNIDYKEFDDTSLTDVSTAAANTWTILTVVVIPLAIAAVGVVIYVRRRHS